MQNVRIYKYDNIKAFLILLVIIGHMSTPYVRDSHMLRSITLFLCIFHMPAFIFLAGLFHKQSNIKRAIGYFICAYLLKIIIFYTRILGGQNPTWEWFREERIPWFLMALSMYEIIFLIADKINKKHLMIISILCSLVVGYFNFNDILAINRMFNFLPFFTLGYILDKDKLLSFLENKKTKRISCIIIFITILSCIPWKAYPFRVWVAGKKTYYSLLLNNESFISYAWLLKLGTLILSSLVMFAIMSLISNKNITYITTSGQQTLQVYFWHRPFCYLIQYFGVFPYLLNTFKTFGVILYILLSMLLYVILNLSLFKQPTTYIMKLTKK